MGFSAIFHLFNVKNPEVAINLARLDYAGIAFLIYGSAVPAASYGFACESVARKWIQIPKIYWHRTKANLLLLARWGVPRSHLCDIFPEPFKTKVQPSPSFDVYWPWIRGRDPDCHPKLPAKHLLGPEYLCIRPGGLNLHNWSNDICCQISRALLVWHSLRHVRGKSSDLPRVRADSVPDPLSAELQRVPRQTKHAVSDLGPVTSATAMTQHTS